MKNIVKIALNIIFPPKCAACKEILPYYSTALMFDKCIEKWKTEKETKCSKCGKIISMCRCMPESCTDNIDMLISVAPYTSSGSVTDRLVLYAKENNDRSLFSFMANEMTAAIYADLPSAEDIIVTFVPRSLARKSETGHDQSEYLAKLVAENFSVNMMKLFRKRGKIQQKTLGAQKRAENAENSYLLLKNTAEKVMGRTVLLCDDVVTTGASISVCAKQLLNAGAQRVYALTFAKTVKK